MARHARTTAGIRARVPRARTPLVALALAALLLSLATAAHAAPVESRARVRDIPPEVLSAELLVQPTAGGLLYRIEARDDNGVEDLTLARLVFLDAHGNVLHTHEDDAPRADGRRAAVWSGLVLAPQALDAQRADVTVADRQGTLSEPRGADPILPPVSHVPAARAPARVGLLGQTATILEAPRLSEVLVAAAALWSLAAAAGAAYLIGRATARPRRS